MLAEAIKNARISAEQFAQEAGVMEISTCEVSRGKTNYIKETIDSLAQAMCVLSFGIFHFETGKDKFIFSRNERGEIECEYRVSGNFLENFSGEEAEKVLQRLLKKDREVA
ncbi:hypothetical protein KKH36_02945 [Patescibacteria group bacterium]|nr:hypothetical protein [Patescibacteria group bacterium]